MCRRQFQPWRETPAEKANNPINIPACFAVIRVWPAVFVLIELFSFAWKIQIFLFWMVVGWYVELFLLFCVTVRVKLDWGQLEWSDRQKLMERNKNRRVCRERERRHSRNNLHERRASCQLIGSGSCPPHCHPPSLLRHSPANQDVSHTQVGGPQLGERESALIV